MGSLTTPVNVGHNTQQRFDDMLAKASVMLREIGVPISDSICPHIVFIKTYAWYGQCCQKTSKYGNPDYDFVIRISSLTVNNTERSLMNTMLHELIHTVPGNKGHMGEWKRWADYANEKLGYDISYRNSKDKTVADRKKLWSGITRTPKSLYIVECEDCGHQWFYHRRTKYINCIHLCRCPFCKTNHLYAWKEN